MVAGGQVIGVLYTTGTGVHLRSDAFARVVVPQLVEVGVVQRDVILEVADVVAPAQLELVTGTAELRIGRYFRQGSTQRCIVSCILGFRSIDKALGLVHEVVERTVQAVVQ